MVSVAVAVLECYGTIGAYLCCQCAQDLTNSFPW